MDEYASKLADALAAHDRLDTERFDALTGTLDRIDANVESLLQSRSFARGAWKATATISVAISSLIGIVFAFIGYIRGH
jgi:hypothetical protein